MDAQKRIRGRTQFYSWRLWTNRVSRFVRGEQRPTYLFSRWVFLRGLGVVYLIAFVSLGTQVIGLIGENGILPAGGFLEHEYQERGAEAYRLLPTLCWFTSSDAFMRILCWGGAVLSVLLIAGVAPAPVLALLWIFYLSLTVAGQTFLSFQWDVLLLETGLLAVFYAPMQLLPSLSRERRSSAVMRWLLWALLFKLVFLSGITKVVSQDKTWADWTALLYHYETQPIPTWTSWYAHHLPEWFDKMSVGGMYFIELIVPFLIFVPSRIRVVRWVACGFLVLLQLLIAATGNYGFFNWLSIVLCLTLLDDAVWRRVLPKRLVGRVGDWADRPCEHHVKRVLVGLVALIVLPVSTLVFVREITGTIPQPIQQPPEPIWPGTVMEWVSPLHSINGYGLFRVMTTRRPEIVIEGSHDAEVWVEYQFRWKPGDVNRRPTFVAPHQPRLDWQMWFAALNPRRAEHWLLRLVERLLEGSPQVLELLDEDEKPFPDKPPKYIRLVYYNYHFSGPEEPTAWWTRERLGELTRPLSLSE